MKKQLTLSVLFLLIITGLNAQTTVSGILDSSLSMTAKTGDAQGFSFGVEEYANIRFQSRLRDNRAIIYGAVNLIAAAGNYATNAALMASMSSAPTGFISTPYVAGENYIAAIELERLYFRLNFESANFDGGLFRLPFGFSQVWGSSDFLNPKNPLKPDARPRGVLGAAFSAFPKGEIKVTSFAVTPRNPMLNDGSSVLAGVSFENHWEKMSAQVLYSYEIPKTGSRQGIHRAGLSVKADVEVGLSLDALYTYNHEAGTGVDGLSLSFGADYSFFDGKLIVMAEYLYNGASSSTAFDPVNNLLGMKTIHNLYTGFTFLINDFTNISLALISCFDEVSFTPIVTFSHDLFQGAALAATATAPLDKDVFDNGNFAINLSAKLRLRF